MRSFPRFVSGNSLASNTVQQNLESGYLPIDPFTIHDLRRTGSTRLHEAGFASDLIEKTLNHTIGGVRGIYNRAEYASQRREVLQFWADCVDALATEKKVILDNFGQRTAVACPAAMNRARLTK